MYKTASDTWKEGRYKRLRGARNASGEEQTCGITRYVARRIVKYVFGSIGGTLGSNSFSRCKVDRISKLTSWWCVAIYVGSYLPRLVSGLRSLDDLLGAPRSVIAKHVIRPTMSCQTMMALKAMEVLKHVIASLKLSTLAAYISTMLHHFTIPQSHSHPLSVCLGLPLLSSCPPFSSYLITGYLHCV